MLDRNAALEEVRKRMREKKGGRARDPMQFSPPQVKAGEELRLKFYVLPPVSAGDQTAAGKASRSMDLWYMVAGTHWINNKPYECPRIHDGNDCAFCQLGFDLLKGTDDDDERKNIVKTYFPKQSWVVNIYFPPFESTPQDLRGKVMWYAMPKTVYDIMESTIMRDASKDELDPQAYGLFYDPNDAYVFQLDIKHQGGYNEYKSSKFLPATRGAMVKRKGTNELDDAAMSQVLDLRHDLFTKFAARDPEALAKRAHEVLHGEADRTPARDTTLDSHKKLNPQPPTRTSVVEEDRLVDEPAEEVKPVAPVATAPAVASKPSAKPAVKTAASTAVKPTPQVTEDTPDDELAKLLDDIRNNKG